VTVRYPDVQVDVSDLIAVDAWAHAVKRVEKAIRTAGHDTTGFCGYNGTATSDNPWAVIAQWVSLVGPDDIIQSPSAPVRVRRHPGSRKKGPK
jgi:hypothetical protein